MSTSGPIETDPVKRTSGADGGVSGHVVLRIARLVAARGYDPEPLFSSFDLRVDELGAGDARVPYPLVEEIGLRAAEITGVRDVGLELGRGVAEPETLKDAGMLLVMASATVRSALERVVRIQELWGDGARFAMLPAEDGGLVRYMYPRPLAARSRHVDECAMAEVVVALRHLTGEEIRPRVVRFPHARPGDTRGHAELFRCPLEFSADHTELVLDQSTLSLPMRHAHEVYREIFEREVERALASRPRARALSSQVRTLVRAAVAVPDHASHAARALRTSTRTLQRRLREEGTSLGEIVEEVRLELAERYLAQALPIKEIASKLGYTEPSAFHRAFKRWTGLTPDERRRDLGVAS